MGTLLNPTCGSLQEDLVESVYIPKGPPNPNSRELRRHEIPEPSLFSVDPQIPQGYSEVHG